MNDVSARASGVGKAKHPAIEPPYDVAEIDPFRPRLVLRFGVTGHRPPRLSPTNYAAIKAQCAGLFKSARMALEEIHGAPDGAFSPAPPHLKMVSSLAEGADVLAAQAAVESGLILTACLPFPPDIYAEDFDEEAWAATRAMLGQSGSVMALADPTVEREHAYEIAGRMVLSQSDILIAIWDGEGARGRGGTTEIVAEAVARHQPVIHIDANGRNPPKLLWSGLHEAIPDRPSLDGVARSELDKTLPVLISALCSSPEGEERAKLDQFFHARTKAGKRSWAWPLLLGLTGAKALRARSFRAPSPEECSDALGAHTEAFKPHGRFGQVLNSMIRYRYGQADAQAGHFSLRFRSSFVTNFAMAGVAVFLAVLGLLVPDIKGLAVTGELVVILLIVANTHGANRHNYHQYWLDRRHLAERLRMLSISAPLGRLSLRDAENGTTVPSWVSWYARATARELGLVQTMIDRAYLEKVRATMLALIDDQVAYHRHNAKVMHDADHRLHKAGDWLFLGTILACVAYLAGKYLFGNPASILGVGTAQLTTFVTALFPALAAAMYGIRMQADLAATSERSSAMARQLHGLRNAIEGDPVTYDRLIERNRRLGEIMLAEVHQWQMQYETRPLSLPG